MGKNKPGKSYFILFKKNWTNYLSESNSRIELALTLIWLVCTLVFFTHFINIVEAREGVQLNDPVLRIINPVDLSGFIFSIIYISIIIGLINFLNEPNRLVFALQVYSLLVMIRIVTLYLTPFNPPEQMIPLIDPVVKNFGTGQLLTKDLFFSGHTATMFFLFLVSVNRKIKTLFFFGFIAIAIAVLLQHVHYAIDVAAAPFFTYASYRIVLLIRKKFGLN